MRASSVPLRQPLPDDVVVGGEFLWTRYRRYPVFSAPWLVGRTLLFGSVILGFSLLTLLGALIGPVSAVGAFTASAYMFAAFLLMTTAGPLLATCARHLRLPLRRERTCVVLSLCIGIALSYFADRWASARIDAFMVAEMGKAPYDLEAMRAHYASGAARSGAIAIQLLTAVGIYGLLGGGTALRAYFGEQRRLAESRHRLELATVQAHKRESDLRLGALQAQVEPHFLFNTLASVRALVRQDPLRAEATLDALVDYLRATIPRLRDGEAALRSTLGEQLDLCTHYLELMRLRTADRLRYTVESDAELRALPYPPLLLITLVENAVKHGIEPKPGAGRIAIRAWRADALLHVSVSDDGAGLQPGVGSGMGLANVRDQLATRFGPRASLRLTGAAGGGAHAEIRTPLEVSA
ncbi:sensor histidine kinase [Luteimonas terrae]|uniref:Signal transduction histidine kinase n=1 Tax=Luteimonas terrae TaxID=1530191 RepID=A0ABU1XTL1_9GAMM|nr:histidine kinase [Luteimonas terrae]MDR7191570.1 signal transduction histidine kinase [Luteimonas terrae]